MKLEKQKEFLIRSAFYLTVGLFVYIALKLISGPLLPFALAILITVLLQRTVRRLSKKLKLKKKATSVIAVLTAYIIAGGLISWGGYALYKQLIGFASKLPEFAEEISALTENVSAKVESLFGNFTDSSGFMGAIPDMTVDSIAESLADILADLAGSIASKIPTFVISVVIMIVASTYFAKDYDEICEYLLQKLPKKFSNNLIDLKNDIMISVSGMVKGYAIIMVMTFLELVVGLSLVGSEYALIIAVFTAIVDILPIFGSGTVLIPWAIVSALLGNYKKAVGVAAVYLVITAVRNFAEPKIIGSELGVHPLVMLTSVFLGLSLFGATGILIMPLAVIVGKRLLERKGTPIST